MEFVLQILQQGDGVEWNRMASTRLLVYVYHHSCSFRKLTISKF